MEYDYAIRKITAKIIDRLYDNGNLDKAALASLRSAATITSQRAQSVWPLLMKYLPEQFLSKNGEPTIGEIAVFAAIRLYAIQQQGKDELVCGDSTKKEIVEVNSISLCTAINRLKANKEIKVLLDQRIRLTSTTDNINSVTNCLTRLVKILKTDKQNAAKLVSGDATKNKVEEADGVSLFTALAKLRASEDIRVALDRRIQPLLATNNIASVINSLTHLVEILKATEQPLKIDYPLLAQDLYDFQTNYHRAGKVRLSWGEQYFEVNNSNNIKGEEND
ncbi:type I-E CRISPR-associated protein Cse2/CasB [Lactobacillus sp. ESL0677]|uniref:type I-E CRISPR-associated protein Cse2/CasB n=1 Tax=Lactobacillus sp. ESL0677 TaxID=2983208 RepID=UPI0023F93013|nr:type I-E CRISPR-associated protein Cse2/CasB [Lactobacillus sp. ESL0677]WEV36924.1 type I-E CRISPR-associated protein Cse2/CasB [Lactobacillus sp. ESL0677]